MPECAGRGGHGSTGGWSQLGHGEDSHRHWPDQASRWWFVLSVGFLDSCHQFVKLFNAARDVPHECLLDAGVEVTFGKHEIYPYVLQLQCEDFPVRHVRAIALKFSGSCEYTTAKVISVVTKHTKTASSLSPPPPQAPLTRSCTSSWSAVLFSCDLSDT